MKIMSNTHIIFHPNINRIRPHTQWPSTNLVKKPSTHDVAGIIQRIKDNRLGVGVPNMQQYLNHLLNKQREEGVTL